jgi:sugar phosphate isomerase/epimerase
LKRAIDVAEEVPFSRMVFHMGGTRETADPRKRDAAFSSLEHLILHAKHVGVTICVENTMSEMGSPAYLRSFIDETRLTGLRINFDIGHAHLSDGTAENRVSEGFEPLREFVASAHIHDNHGDKDEHLPPYEGSIDWTAAAKLLKTATEIGTGLPLTLELKEKVGPEAPTTQQQLDAARRSLDKLEEAWD